MSTESDNQMQQAIDGYDKHIGSGTRPIAVWLATSGQVEGIDSPDAVILDNACGTALVAEEIIRHGRKVNKPLPRIYAADIKDNLTALASFKIQQLDVGDRVSVHTTPGEKLEFEDDLFTHSITSCGLPFFADADAGAREIYRTLRSGGTAVITSAAHLSYIETIIVPGHLAARPAEPSFVNPLDPRWRDEAAMEKCMRDAGFKNVRSLIHTAYYAGETREEALETLLGLWWLIKPEWTEEEKGRFADKAKERLEEATVECTMWDGRPGFGFEMGFIVVIGQK